MRQTTVGQQGRVPLSKERGDLPNMGTFHIWYGRLALKSSRMRILGFQTPLGRPAARDSPVWRAASSVGARLDTHGMNGGET